MRTHEIAAGLFLGMIRGMVSQHGASDIPASLASVLTETCVGGIARRKEAS